MGFFSSFFSLFLISSTILANPIQRRTISTQLLDTFNLYEQYAGAAYCAANNNSPDTKITCTENACPLVQAANTNSVTEFQNTNATDTTGFVAIDSTNKLIVISYRGSESLKNYIADLRFMLVSTDLCTTCSGDTGFWNSWLETRGIVIPAVQGAVLNNPSYKVLATGHSLGAAVATFAAAELRKSGIPVDLVTFGSPRVGNADTATYITNQATSNLGANYRLTHHEDPVPRLPPESFDYQHVQPEYYISSGNNVTVTVNDVSQCSDCNEDWISFNIEDHSWYFNKVSACYPTETNV